MSSLTNEEKMVQNPEECSMLNLSVPMSPYHLEGKVRVTTISSNTKVCYQTVDEGDPDSEFRVKKQWSTSYLPGVGPCTNSHVVSTSISKAIQVDPSHAIEGPEHIEYKNIEEPLPPEPLPSEPLPSEPLPSEPMRIQSEASNIPSESNLLLSNEHHHSVILDPGEESGSVRSILKNKSRSSQSSPRNIRSRSPKSRSPSVSSYDSRNNISRIAQSNGNSMKSQSPIIGSYKATSSESTKSSHEKISIPSHKATNTESTKSSLPSITISSHKYPSSVSTKSSHHRTNIPSHKSDIDSSSIPKVEHFQPHIKGSQKTKPSEGKVSRSKGRVSFKQVPRSRNDQIETIFNKEPIKSEWKCAYEQRPPDDLNESFIKDTIFNDTKITKGENIFKRAFRNFIENTLKKKKKKIKKGTATEYKSPKKSTERKGESLVRKNIDLSPIKDEPQGKKGHLKEIYRESDPETNVLISDNSSQDSQMSRHSSECSFHKSSHVFSSVMKPYGGRTSIPEHSRVQYDPPVGGCREYTHEVSSAYNKGGNVKLSARLLDSNTIKVIPSTIPEVSEESLRDSDMNQTKGVEHNKSTVDESRIIVNRQVLVEKKLDYVTTNELDHKKNSKTLSKKYKTTESLIPGCPTAKYLGNTKRSNYDPLKDLSMFGVETHDMIEKRVRTTMLTQLDPETNPSSEQHSPKKEEYPTSSINESRTGSDPKSVRVSDIITVAQVKHVPLE